MSRNYSIGQRCLAYVLLVSCLLQSCYNPAIPSGPIANKQEEISVKLTSLDQADNQKSEEPSALALIASDLEENLKMAEEVKQLPIQVQIPTTPIAYNTSQETKRRAYESYRNNPPVHTKSRPVFQKAKPALVAEVNDLSQSVHGNHKVIPEVKKVAYKADQLATRTSDNSATPSHLETNKKLALKPFSAKGGHQVYFQQLDSGAFQALVAESLPAGIKRKLLLPVYFLPGYSLVDVSKYLDNSAWQKQHIHVNLNNTNSCVLVGKMGLLGGMIRKEWDNNSMPQAQQQSQQGVFSYIDRRRDKIGEGGFAVVYKGTWQRNPDRSILVAIKVLRDIGNDEILSQETAIMQNLIHKNIVRFFGIHNIKIGNNRADSIITELMTEGSVESFLKKDSKSSIKPMFIVSMALDAAIGMRYLHENDIIHGDLAARNLLLTLSNNKHLVKVSDFGLSRELPFEQEGVGYSSSLSVNPDRDPARWSAPELFTRKKVSRRSDLWSFGVVLYELFNLCQVKPYKDLDREKIIEKLKSGEKMYQYLSIPECPEGVQELVNSCMNNEPKARLEFNKIIYRLEEIQDSVKVNNSWRIKKRNSGEAPADKVVDRGYDKPASSAAEINEDKGVARRSVSSREASRASLEQEGAEQGDTFAQTNLGKIQDKGQGLAQAAKEEISSSRVDTSNFIPAVASSFIPRGISSPSEEVLSVQEMPLNTPSIKGRDWSLAPEIQTIKGHTSFVYALIELSDGLLASGSEDNTIKIWDQAGKCVKTLEGHTSPVFTLIELRDGRLASGSADRTIKIWDRAGNCIKTLEGHTSFVYTLIGLSDGGLASGSWDNTIKIWDQAGNCIKTFKGHTDLVCTLIELSDGRLASGSGNKTIKIWDQAGNCIKTLEGHRSSVLTLIELSDGRLASGSDDKTIKIWDQAGNCIKTLEGHTKAVTRLIELSNRRLASGSYDETIKIWDRAGNCIKTLEGHTQGIYTLTELRDGRLASGAGDQTIKIWDFQGLKQDAAAEVNEDKGAEKNRVNTLVERMEQPNISKENPKLEVEELGNSRLQKAADQGDPNAQLAMGAMYAEGQGVNQDAQNAFEWYQKAADKGNADAQNRLGVMYRSGQGVKWDYQKAFEWFQKAADKGNADAQTNLGVMYESGQGLKRDYQKAFKWFQKAANQGNVDAQNRLGVMYEYGQGVNQDAQKAVEWYQKAADQGLAAAQFNLGSMYEKGQGVNQDAQKAVEWYQKAAHQGLATAQNRLGLMYRSGQGVNQDYQKAVEWFQKAADQGYVNAQFHLGVMHESGQGVNRDAQKAFEWYQKAAHQGLSDAQHKLRELTK
jgi:TPR repeat protein/WD40 repeat protein